MLVRFANRLRDRFSFTGFIFDSQKRGQVAADRKFDSVVEEKAEIVRPRQRQFSNSMLRPIRIGRAEQLQATTR